MIGRSAAPQAGRITPGLMLVLGYISMAGSLSTDLYLPAFPSITDAFGVGASGAQLTLTAFLVGGACGQLIIGSISDALGRRFTLLVGLAIFALCGVTVVFSLSIQMFIAVRFLQGLAGAAGTVLARAVISDISDPRSTAKAYSVLFVIISFGPALGNPIGAWLTQLGGWRAPMICLSLLSVGMFVAAALRIPESLPLDKRQPFDARVLAGNIGRLVRRPEFMGFALAFGLGYAAMMVYISASSFIAQGIYELSPVQYSLIFSFGSVTFMVGALFNGRLAGRIGPHRSLRVGQCVQMLMITTGASLALLGTFPLPAYVAIIATFTFATGMIMPGASALAVGQAAGMVGAGSSIVGFGQFLFGALGTPLGSVFGTESAAPTFLTMLVLSVGSFVMGGIAIRRLPKFIAESR
ncbi:multidrug effflux MFS transporter [Leucobacter sp. 1207-22]|uniref:multidrug effflux MFS transporter n=1 Tax=Leucobacter sp. 1207-22 TaxID=2604456 RepID=UPI004062BC30